MSVDWAGRITPTGTFRESTAADVVAALQAALDAIPDSAVAIVGLDGRVLLARGGALERLGVPPASLEGRHMDELPVRVWDDMSPVVEAALAGESCEVVRHADGRSYLTRVAPVRDREGTVVAAVIVASDSTVAQRTHEALVASEERFRLLAENSSDFVMRTTPDGVIEWVSAGMIDVLGWEPDEMVGRRSLDFAHPDYVAAVLAATTQVNEGAVVSGRIQVRAKDGSYRWMHRTLRPVLDADGAVVARVSGWHDAQAEVEAEQRLVASEALFRAAMESAGVGMALISLDRTITRVNRAFRSMLGRDDDDLVGRSFGSLVHPADQEHGRRLSDEIDRGERDSFTQRVRCRTSAGAYLWVDASVASARDADGELVLYVVQLVDVSAEVASVEALARAARDFQSLAENASDVVFRIDQHGIVTWVSPSVRTVLGWEPGMVVGAPSLGLIVPEDRERVLDRRARTLDGHRDGPLVVRLRTSWGTELEMSALSRPLLDDNERIVGSVVGLRDVTEEQRMRRELAYRATHDALTGMTNRDDLMTRLRSRLDLPAPSRGRLGVLFCDVDNLKAINDTYGHAAGDAVLVEVAQRLTGAVRARDIVSRLSGDEFVVLLDHVEDEAALERIIDKCRDAVSAVVRRGDAQVAVSISVGGVLAEPDEDAGTVIDRADRAMFTDKGRRDGRPPLV